MDTLMEKAPAFLKAMMLVTITATQKGNMMS
nr:MAG TPA: hypothetical protein [Caudoviricetes sp.]